MNSPASNSLKANAVARRPGMGGRTARGLAWMVSQTLANKAAAFIAQIILAWVLLEDDFGLFAMASAIASLAMLVEWVGMRDVLVRRANRIHLWLMPSLWMSLIVGLITGAIICGLAPLAAWMYGERVITPLIVIMAVGAPLQAIQIPATAYLQINLRFRSLAMIGSVRVLLTAALSVILAVLGFGAFSFAIPIPLAILAQAALVWGYARPPLQMRVHLRRWKYILGDSMLLTAANLLRTVVTRGDYLVLGLFHSAQVVGVYFFAYQLSAQVLRLMTNNLANVLAPVISHLRHEPQRQLQGFLRTSKGVIAVGLPLCVMNVAIAEPLFHLLFRDKWDDSIPVYQILSFGLAFRMAEGASFAMIKGAGRFRVFALLCFVSSVLFAVPATIAAALGGAHAVAWTLTIWSIGFGPVAMYFGVNASGGTWRQVLDVFIHPLVVALPAVGTGYMIASGVAADMPGREWVQIGINVMIGGGAYVALLKILAPSTWGCLADAVSRIRVHQGRLRRGKEVGSDAC